MSEEPPKNENTAWVVAGVVAAIALIGCCLIGIILAAIGFFVPVRSVSMSQIITSGPVLAATPTPVFLIPLDTLPPVPPPATEVPADMPTAIAPTEPPAAVPDGAQTGTVVKSIDGDTIDVNIDGKVFRVRYIGINTPETDQTCESEATAANQSFVDGHQVTLVKDTSETDKYGRLLRYVYVGETFVNAQMVRDGWAEAVAYPPDTKYADMFRELQGQAREQNIGCWPSGVWGEMPPVQATTSGSAGDAVCDCSANKYNCGDFKTHAEAQACYEYCVQTVGHDVHKLDGDRNGSACESLP